ncbi:hypothetical protein [Plebeiibacterium sediminum]|uniref:Uncharacterized protein n=1 Tax=Plebeiibacterium sediminum TaxID=2992112 RepID=A0AAE3M6Z1_9BACT|nr:hypothetical protein [Plebeiobacterium sediminum]MCW3788182.1 hypothetical protein [Plebeiobacterium sediminum]
MNISINTEIKSDLADVSLFICAVGFEERSIYHFKKLINENKITKTDILCFSFNDFIDEISVKNKDILREFGVELIDVSKNEKDEIIDEIKKRIESLRCNLDSLNIHIDYSSMPRNWYCNIFLSLINILGENDKVFYWYSHGDYSSNLEHCSTAGTDDITVFAGKASINPLKRSHIFGIGFDRIKTDAIRTILDPSTLVICYTYPEDKPDMNSHLVEEHKYLFDSAALSFSLPIEDYSFMVNRLTDIALDLKDSGDVILVPDGPKPLILACSIIPILLKKEGIIAMHIQSHSNFKPENIKATGKISGFSVTRN